MNKDREVPVRIIYRKKRHGHAAHGGAWKVAFADFMTSMFALFLVLWLVNQSTDIKSAIAGYFQDPLGRATEFGSSILPGEGAQTASVRPMTAPEVLELRRDRLRSVADHLKERLDRTPELAAIKSYVEIELTDEGLKIQLIEDSTGVFFETGRSTPNPRGSEILTMLASEIGAVPNPVRIEGYTDARPYSGTSLYTNWELSADRANAARRILTASGVAESRISQIRGFADRSLRDPTDPFSAKNRRITITVLFEPSEAEAADSTGRAPGAAGTTTPAVATSATSPIQVP